MAKMNKYSADQHQAILGGPEHAPTPSLANSLALSLALAAALSGCDTAPDSLRSQQQGDTSPRLSAGRAPESQTEPLSQALSLAAQASPTAQQPLKLMSFDASQVCQTITYRDRKGAVVKGQKNCSFTLCSADGATGCQLGGDFRSVDKATIDGEKIHLNTTIAGVAGNFDPNKYVPCDDSGSQECLVQGDYIAAASSKVNPGTIKRGHPVGAMLIGAYPSSSHPLQGNKPGTYALTKDNVVKALSSKNTHYFWNQTGVLQEFKGHSNLTGSNILHGKTVLGVGGTHNPAPAKDCKAEGDKDCFIKDDGQMVAVDKSKLTPGVVKKFFVIAGVMGAYPSVAHRLERSTPMTDLDFYSFSQLGPIKLTNDSSFEYFTAAGERQVNRGDSNLAKANIKKGATILGIGGAAEGFDPASIKPSDLRAGVRIPNSTQKGSFDPMKTCASKADCLGDGKIWQDMGKRLGDPVGPDCSANSDLCVFRNHQQRLDWAFPINDARKTWQQAKDHCNRASYGQKSDWRLATQKEIMMAATQGLAHLGHLNWIKNQYVEHRTFWTSTVVNNTDKAYAHAFPDNRMFNYRKTENQMTVCVRSYTP